MESHAARKRNPGRAAVRSCRCWPCRWLPCSDAWRWPSTSAAWRWPRRNARMRPTWRPSPARGRSAPAAAANQAAATTNAQNAAIANPILGADPYGRGNRRHPRRLPLQSDQPDVRAAVSAVGDRQLQPHPGDDHAPGAGHVLRHLRHASFSTVTATATAAYRPRDVAIVLDYSGSMNNESDIWNCESYLGSMDNTPNNTDPVFPQFGPYNPTFSPLATLQCTSSDTRVGMCNVTQAVLGIPAMANDFYQNNFGAGAVSAFTIASTTCTAPVSGDNYLTASGNCVLTWSDAVNPSTSFFPGYSNFKGYTQGPGYWGKTFFIWPPQPGSDWRKLYFELTSGAPLNDNTKLWNSSGNWQNPPGNYIINYKAILNWIKNIGPNPFPSQLRAGNILYYSSIPSDVPAAAYDPTQPNSNINGVDGGTTDQRFWKEYIDYVIGVWMDPNGNVQNPGHPIVQLRTGLHRRARRRPAGIQITGPDYQYKSGYAAFIDPNDNPKRPRHRLWFGPMTMIQFMSDTGLLPGTTHDISMVVAKLGIAGALQDIQNNHPNDLVSLIMFSRPPFSGEAAAVRTVSLRPQQSQRQLYEHDQFPLVSAQQQLGRRQAMGRQRSADAAGPRRLRLQHHDRLRSDAGLQPVQLQHHVAERDRQRAERGHGRIRPRGGAENRHPGNGRHGQPGDQRHVHQSAEATIPTTILPPLGTVSASGSAADASALAVATADLRLTTDNTNGPGYATAQKPVLIYCIAFGAIFEPTASGSEQTSAVAFLQSLATIGGTTFPSSANDPTYGYLWCIGTLSPAPGQAAAGVHHHHGPDRIDHPGALISARRRRNALCVESRVAREPGKADPHFGEEDEAN